MKEWLDIKELLFVIITVVISLLIIVMYSIWHPKIKWMVKYNRYCILWEKIQHYEEMDQVDRYELELGYIHLPKIFNIFKKWKE